MKVFISVVSHGHSCLINRLACLLELCKNFQVIVKSNKSGDDFSDLMGSENFHWIDKSYQCGFGHNNNMIYSYCQSNLDMKEDDYFIVLNPDVIIDTLQLSLLIELMERDGCSIAAINLFKDASKKNYDYSVRNFPTFKQFLFSFLGLNNKAIIDKKGIVQPCSIDWAAGSFLAFKSSHYKGLGGFDEKYFMYCEDIDICYRSFKQGRAVTYYPEVQAVHLAQHKNRKIFSIHFYWHITSAIKFLLTKKGIVKCK